MRFPSTICRLFAVGFNAHSLRLLRRGGLVVCSVVVRRAFDVIACVWSPSLACVETAAMLRWLSCRSACGSRRRSAGCLRSGSTRTRSVFCGVVDSSFAASLYGARSTSSRVSGRRRSPVLRPPRCCAGCRAVRRALPVEDLQAVRGRVQRVRARRFPSTICRLFAVGFNAHSLSLLRRGGPVVCSVVVRRAFDVIACVWSPSLACVETTAMLRWLSCRSACASRRRSAGCLRSRSTCTCRALPVDDLQLVAVGFNTHSLRLLRRGGPVVCSVVVRRAFDVIACVWSPSLACVGTTAMRRWLSCRSACGFRLRSARRPRSSSTCTCFVVDASLAASLYRVRRSRSTRRAYAANTVVGVRPPGASNSGFAALLYASLLS